MFRTNLKITLARDRYRRTYEVKPPKGYDPTCEYTGAIRIKVA